MLRAIKQMLNMDTITYRITVNMERNQQAKQFLTELFVVGLNAVNGQAAVERQLQHHPLEGNIAIIAIGKAAAAMMSGAKNILNAQIQSALIITKAGHANPRLQWTCIESGHPIPDANSLEAGTKLLEFIAAIPHETKLLALISGGASALAEVLPDNMDLTCLQKINQWLLSSGLTIKEMNLIRQSVSLIKAGKVLHHFSQSEMTQFLISDVPQDDPEIIGSGLFVSPEQHKHRPLPKIPAWLQEYSRRPSAPAKVSVESHIIANNEMACQAIISRAKQANYAVSYHGQTLYGDVYEVAQKIASELINAKAGVHIWGGETTLTLPDNPGRGGRNQSLALALGCYLENSDGITVLVGATDGSDGPTEDAGAIIDGQTVRDTEDYPGEAREYLDNADAGTFLAKAGVLISTGPTGTNVMDLVIAIKE